LPRVPNRNGEAGAIATRPALDRKDQKRREAEHRQARSRERKEQQRIVHGFEKEINELEQRQTALIVELEKPETYQQAGRAAQINRELVGIQQDLVQMTARWEEAAAKLAVFESA